VGGSGRLGKCVVGHVHDDVIMPPLAVDDVSDQLLPVGLTD